MNLPIKTGHLFIIAAIGLGLITMILFGTMGKSAKKAVPPAAAIQTQAVVVPTVPIIKGEVLTVDKLRVVQWPTDFLPKGLTYQTISPLLGRVPMQDLMPGEPIFSQKLSSPDTDGLPALIPSGHRAITLSVTEVKGVAGFIKPGDHVDVITTFSLSGKRDDGSRNKYYRTVTLVQNVLVLASAQMMVQDKKLDIETPPGVTSGKAQAKSASSNPAEDSDTVKDRRKKDDKADKPKTEQDLEKEKKAAEKERKEAEKRAKLVSSVTLAVTPTQAQKLTLAEEAGDLRLVLRSTRDIRNESIAATESEDVVYADKPPRPPARAQAPVRAPRMPAFPSVSAPPLGNQVELIEGTSKSSVQF